MGLERRREFTVSKTDKTRPWWVKMVESPSNYKESHNHGKVPLRDEHGKIVQVAVEGQRWPQTVYVQATECDLPPAPGPDREWGSCHWTETAHFIHTVRYCGCPMCTGQDWRRQERRKERYEGRRQARDWWREY